MFHTDFWKFSHKYCGDFRDKQFYVSVRARDTQPKFTWLENPLGFNNHAMISAQANKIGFLAKR